MNAQYLKFWKALPIMAGLFACTGGQVVTYAIPDPVFREMMDYEIAQTIAQNCQNLNIRVSKVEARARIVEQLSALGISQKDINPLMRKARTERGEAYKKAYLGILPVKNGDYCAIGNYEIKRKSRIGNLLLLEG